MRRREFLKWSVLAGAVAAVRPSAALGVAPAGAARASAASDLDRFGPLRLPDENGLWLPEGFRSKILAESLQPVRSSGVRWHLFPDGGAVFPGDDGGWAYVSNSEMLFVGGAQSLLFARNGALVGATTILRDTSLNCAGGATPWGTWLSCEEHPLGRVWECDPFGRREAVVRPAMGTFTHEAVAFDPRTGWAYMTEDVDGGGLYRFRPDRPGDLSSGVLEIAYFADDGNLDFVAVPEPNPGLLDTPTREQVSFAARFDNGEGVAYRRGSIFFTTKGDNRVWRLWPRTGRLEVLYDPAGRGDPPDLKGVDNVATPELSTLVFVCEDNGNMEIVAVAPDGRTRVVLRVAHALDSELTGVAFDPTGTRMYFSSQRGRRGGGTGTGLTYQVKGPWMG